MKTQEMKNLKLNYHMGKSGKFDMSNLFAKMSYNSEVYQQR